MHLTRLKHCVSTLTPTEVAEEPIPTKDAGLLPPCSLPLNFQVFLPITEVKGYVNKMRERRTVWIA
jgi:hypothetical protein